MSPNDVERRRSRLIEAVRRLSPERLGELEGLVARWGGPEGGASPEGGAGPPPGAGAVRDWPHAPLHRLGAQGTYLVTAGTYNKEHHFRGADRLDRLEQALLTLAKGLGWHLEAWAVFSNHYHFVGHAPPGAGRLPALLRRLHRETARAVNELDGAPGRRVWCNYWETRLTFEKSYLARLNYVHQNPVRHGLVPAARLYPWCSADWFERTATAAQVRYLASFKIDKVNVGDDYQPV